MQLIAYELVKSTNMNACHESISGFNANNAGCVHASWQAGSIAQILGVIASVSVGVT